MELQDFVSTSLLNIVNGIRAAQDKLGSSGQHVSPNITSHYNYIHQQGKLLSDGKLVHFVEFDVAVTVSASSSSSQGATIGVVSDGARESAAASSGQSRIKFSVPMTLPTPR